MLKNILKYSNLGTKLFDLNIIKNFYESLPNNILVKSFARIHETNLKNKACWH